jgi:quinoprotein relay system zinc metallohydrolase 2
MPIFNVSELERDALNMHPYFLSRSEERSDDPEGAGEAPPPKRDARHVHHGLTRRTFLGGMAAAAFTGPLPVREIAPGVFVHRGPYEEASRANGGAIGNSGFVVGTDAVAAIDSGGSVGEGEALLAAIRAVTDRPVAYVVNTHFHPDHIFGDSVFKGAKIVGHHKMAAALTARGGFYLQRAREELGPAAEGLVVTPPDIAVERELSLDLGKRTLALQAWPTAHTDCDLTIRDLRTDSWFLGDLLFVSRMPTIDGSLRGWIAVLDKLRAQKAARAVPGHGPESAPWPKASDPLLRYLEGLATRIKRAQADGLSLQEATEQVGRDLKGNWVLFDQVHPRNVAVAFAELEWE